VNLEQVQLAVDGVDEPALPCEEVYRPDSSASQPTGLVRQVILDVACREHGAGLILPFDIPETVLILALATGEFLAYAAVHSKCLLA